MPSLSVALLRNTFLRAVKQGLGRCEETHSSYFRSRNRFAATTPWIDFGPNVQAIQRAESEFLLRASWQYIINARTRDDQLKIAQTEIAEVCAFLASVVPPGELVKGTFDFPPTEILPSGEKVTCSFKGVVCGQLPLRTMARAS